ncbi:hypothetical protein D3C74_360710 [compost metagenome]
MFLQVFACVLTIIDDDIPVLQIVYQVIIAREVGVKSKLDIMRIMRPGCWNRHLILDRVLRMVSPIIFIVRHVDCRVGFQIGYIICFTCSLHEEQAKRNNRHSHHYMCRQPKGSTFFLNVRPLFLFHVAQDFALCA